jgi:hypothetical protein
MWADEYPNRNINRTECGSHHELIKIDLPDWNSHGLLWREKLIVHETGHSLGLDHLCPHADSVMCDNTSNWTATMTWQPLDRLHYVNVYPNWQGP